MATHKWDDITEGDVWVVEPSLDAKDSGPGCSYSSDTDSTIDTMETIDSEDIGAFFRVEYGRAFPAYEELPIALPADMEEISRLQIQHDGIKKLVGGALDATIAAQLAPSSDGRRRCVLDVRTQAGIWAEEIAIKFPHVDVKTIDVAPTIPHVPRPNLHHEVYDIHAGILEPTGTFDIVYAQHTISMTKDWWPLLREIHRVLRPGGICIFGELPAMLFAPGEYTPTTAYPVHRSSAFCMEFVKALAKGGVMVDGYTDLVNWLSPEHTLWNSQPSAGFRNITHMEWEAPLNGLWHPEPAMQEVGMLMAMAFSKFIVNTRPLFLSQGFTDSELDEWCEDIRREIRDPMNNAVGRYHLVLGYKP